MRPFATLCEFCDKKTYNFVAFVAVNVNVNVKKENIKRIIFYFFLFFLTAKIFLNFI